MVRVMQSEKVQHAINKLLDDVHKTCPNPDRSNIGPSLYNIFVWQQIADAADKLKKKAWEMAQEENIIPSDDKMRAKFAGEEAIVVESKCFSVIASVGTPRKTFNRDGFIAEVAKKYKIDELKLLRLADKHMVPGTAPLSKRVREAS